MRIAAFSLVAVFLAVAASCLSLRSKITLAKSAPHLTAASKGIAIPFTYDPVVSPFIIVRASINGLPPMPFMVDTGTTAGIVLDASSAEKLHLTISPPTSEGSLPTIPVTSLTIDKSQYPLTVSPQRADVRDLTNLKEGCLGDSFVGVIGQGLLTRFCVTLDFPKKMIVFSRQRAPAGTLSDLAMLPLRFNEQNGLQYVPLHLGSVENELLVDTGAAGVDIPVAVARDLTPEATTGTFYLRVDALYYSQNLLVPRFQLGTYEVPDIVLSAIPSPATPVMGSNVFSRFTTVMDFPAKQLIFRGKKGGVSPANLPGWTGIRLSQQGEVYTAKYVVPGSPSAAADIRPGDQIISIDRHPLKGMPFTLASRIRDGLVGTTATIVLQRGSEPARAVSVRRVSQFTAPKDAIDGMTFKWPYGQPIQILHVDSQCPADLAGLKMNDQIVALNGKPLTNMAVAEFGEEITMPQLSIDVLHEGSTSPVRMTINAEYVQHNLRF